MHKNHYLIIALDVAGTAPGIVFKVLLKALSASSRITLLSQDTDPNALNDNIRLIPLRHAVEKWRHAEKKWRCLGRNPRDERWARRTFREHRDEIFKERYDALIVLTSNGYYSALSLGRVFRQHLLCPYIIYSVDGMPSPLPWLDGDVRLHRGISAGLRRLCSDGDLFLLSNPRMVDYQKSVLPGFQGKWDFLFTPYRPLPKGFSRQEHSGFNILYAGSLYGLRKIDGLTDGFRRFLSVRPDARLYIVGDVWKKYKESAADLVQEGKLIFRDVTDRIDEYYARADCLIDIAADIPDDVFLSSKVICYLPYAVPIIAISGENSPVSRLMGGVASIRQCHNDGEEIFQALQQTQDIRDFSDRQELLEQFSPETIGKRFRELVEREVGKERLIVSLTTWKARFDNIPGVLDSIFAQTLPPDKLILNLAFDEVVPDSLQQYLDRHAVEINRVPDTKVYKKLIPTLRKYPEACVVSIDDDWLYPPQMLEEFMRIHQQNPDSPISGNQESIHHIACHCGCASLTQRKFFGKYLDMIDEDIIRNCPSDDIVYTFFTRINGYTYIHTDSLFFDNMTTYNPSAPYSDSAKGFPVQESWDYLVRRFGHPFYNPAQVFFHRVIHWVFELNRDYACNKKYLRLFGIKIYL